MTLQQHIDEIMDCFDFAKVKRVMDLLDWQWCSCDGVPEIADMRRRVRKMIAETWERSQKLNQDCWISAGGFTVVIESHKEGKNVVVRFELEDCESNPNPDTIIQLVDNKEGGEE